MFKRVEGVLVPLLVAVPLLLWRLDTAPPVWFDEGYKMHAAYQMAFRGFLGTATVAGDVPFDPGISTGPADLAAFAGMFRLLGASVYSARLAGVMFTLLLVSGVYWLFRLMDTSSSSPLRAQWATLVVLAVPPVQSVGLLLTGRQVLGETVALALIVVGLCAVFRQWQTERGAGALVGGLLIGVGLLSKTQVAIALVPALAVVGLMRAWWRGRLDVSSAAPVLAVLGVFVAWQAGTAALTPADVRSENAVLLRDAISSNLLAFPLGRWLSRSAWGMFAVMLGGAAITVWRAWRGGRLGRSADVPWIELTLAAFVAFNAVWFALVSVGWPRYAHAGWVLAAVLWARAIVVWLDGRFPAIEARPRLLTAALVVMVLASQGGAIASSPANADAERMAGYIRMRVLPDEILETWEWELDSLSGHANVSHPPPRYIFLAIRQFSQGKPDFSLQYDALAADPDVLVVGPFAAWTGIYTAALESGQFAEEEAAGSYRLYRRKR